MLSISSASELIAAANQESALNSILSALGFASPPLPLNDAARERLTLPLDVESASVTRSTGSLRALSITLAPNASPRDALIKIASRLSQRVPHLLWLIVARQSNSPLFAIATWSARSSPPKIAALISDQSNVLESDAETLCTLVSTQAISNDVLQHSRWIETLGRESVTRRFYRALERTTLALANSLSPKPPPEHAHSLALLYSSRLLFLAFLETKGWLNNDFGFLINSFANCMNEGGSYQRKVLEPLFFGTLNTRPIKRATRAHSFGKIPFLNGGLFARTFLERYYRKATFPDEALATLFGDVLTRYRLTAREDSQSWSEAAVDPEMLGKVFESLMANHDRKRSGAFYTPQALVERTTQLALINALQSHDISKDDIENALSLNLPNHSVRGRILERTTSISILDPACGSGAFLVHALELLSALRSNLGDVRPISAIRRSILTTSIYGVDINPIAVWLCELRLWLSVVIENDEKNPMHVLPLPNLDHQIRVGNSITGGTFNGPKNPTTARSIANLRIKYSRASGPRKRTLARSLQALERTRTISQLNDTIDSLSAKRKELLSQTRSHNLFNERLSTKSSRTELLALRTNIRKLRAQKTAMLNGAALPFSFATHFPHIADSGGFQVVVGNPPWIRPHHASHESATSKLLLRNTFSTIRNAAWKTGANNAKAGPGFAAQVDVAALFLERSTELLAPLGTLGLLLPAKLWKSLSGGGTREFVSTHLTLSTLEDLSNSPPSFDAATYPSLFIAQQKETTPKEPNLFEPNQSIPTPPPTIDTNQSLSITVHHPKSTVQWNDSPRSLPLDTSAGSPWLLIPPNIRNAFNILANSGSPLAHSSLNRPHLGVKSGCNEAFIVDTQTNDAIARHTSPQFETSHNDDSQNNTNAITHVSSGTHVGYIEQPILRPLIRGATVQPWTTLPSNSRIIWTHDQSGLPLRKLPRHTHDWLSNWQRQLERRSDARLNTPWWSLFRIEAANSNKPRVVWSDFGLTPRATVLKRHDPTVPLNTCYVVPCNTHKDAYALTALLNSPIVAAWLDVIAEPAQNGYRRYLGWTIALLPIPFNWTRAIDILAPITREALKGNAPSADDLNSATLEAYTIAPAAIEPLIAWHKR